MAKFDIHNQLAPRVALNTAAIASSTTTNGTNIIDTQGFGALEFLLNVGARTDGTYTAQLQHGDAANLSDAAVVTSADLLGALPALNTANSVGKVGYTGSKRYVRLNVVSTAVTSGATVGATALLGRPTVAPTA